MLLHCNAWVVHVSKYGRSAMRCNPPEGAPSLGVVGAIAGTMRTADYPPGGISTWALPYSWAAQTLCFDGTLLRSIAHVLACSPPPCSFPMKRSDTRRLNTDVRLERDATAALALYDGSIRHGHRHIALLRYMDARDLAAPLTQRHHEYAQKVASSLSATDVERICGQAIDRSRQRQRAAAKKEADDACVNIDAAASLSRRNAGEVN